MSVVRGALCIIMTSPFIPYLSTYLEKYKSSANSYIIEYAEDLSSGYISACLPFTRNYRIVLAEIIIYYAYCAGHVLLFLSTSEVTSYPSTYLEKCRLLPIFYIKILKKPTLLDT